MVIQVRKNLYVNFVIGILLASSHLLCATHHNLSAFSFKGKMISRKNAGLLMGILGSLSSGMFSLTDYLYHINKYCDAEYETKKFVREVLKEAGYDQNKIDKISILKGKRFCSHLNTIVVPINDKLLSEAYHNKSKNECPDIKNNLSLWRGLIIHEMGHIQHHHIIQRHLFLLAINCFTCALFGAKSSPPSLDDPFGEPDPLKTALAISGSVIYFDYLLGNPLWRYCERQADAEVIKRIKDIEVLEAMQKYFETESTKKLSWFENVQDFFDIHPKDIERAQLFCKAAQQLREDRLS